MSKSGQFILQAGGGQGSRLPGQLGLSVLRERWEPSILDVFSLRFMNWLIYNHVWPIEPIQNEWDR